MTETIKICDSCGKRVNWLYDIPRLIVEGYNINEYPSKKKKSVKNVQEFFARDSIHFV